MLKYNYYLCLDSKNKGPNFTLVFLYDDFHLNYMYEMLPNQNSNQGSSLIHVFLLPLGINDQRKIEGRTGKS